MDAVNQCGKYIQSDHCRTFFANGVPHEIEEAARIDGASQARTFFHYCPAVIQGADWSAISLLWTLGIGTLFSRH